MGNCAERSINRYRPPPFRNRGGHLAPHSPRRRQPSFPGAALQLSAPSGSAVAGRAGVSRQPATSPVGRHRSAAPVERPAAPRGAPRRARRLRARQVAALRDRPEPPDRSALLRLCCCGSSKPRCVLAILGGGQPPLRRSQNLPDPDRAVARAESRGVPTTRPAQTGGRPLGGTGSRVGATPPQAEALLLTVAARCAWKTAPWS